MSYIFLSQDKPGFSRSELGTGFYIICGIHPKNAFRFCREILIVIEEEAQNVRDLGILGGNREKPKTML